MIEYIFGLYLPDSVTIPSFDYLGFKSLNVRNARISGLEISFNGSGNIGPLSTTIQGGYNYNLPIDRDIPRPDSLEHILKYRFFHSAKLDLGFQYRNISMGIYCAYTSRMINVDEVFLDPVFGELILPGFAGYRDRHNEGYIILDHRISYKIKDHSTLSIVTKNLLNREYMGRPGDLRPPRTMSFQYTIEF
jgi:outer membrane cobalamin receptor